MMAKIVALILTIIVSVSVSYASKCESSNENKPVVAISQQCDVPKNLSDPTISILLKFNNFCPHKDCNYCQSKPNAANIKIEAVESEGIDCTVSPINDTTIAPTPPTECCKKVVTLQHKYEELLENLQTILKNLETGQIDESCYQSHGRKKKRKSKVKSKLIAEDGNYCSASCGCFDDESCEEASNDNFKDADIDSATMDLFNSNESDKWYIVPKLKCREKTVSKHIEKCESPRMTQNPICIKKVKYYKSV